MRIDLSGHHVEITEAMRQAVEQKLSKIASHYPQLEACGVILTVERNDQHVEITTHYMGDDFSANAKNGDMYTALGNAVKKLDAELAKKKGAQKAKRHQTVAPSDPDKLAS
ncbi:MAG: ribosome-associated translation inhibitor RaiA [Agarilytica sp.]